MNELEKIVLLKAEIKEKHREIEQSIFRVVKMFGGEVESKCGRTYKATETTGVSCVIEAFIIEDEQLMIKAYFDESRFDLTFESFHTEGLADILTLIIEENNRHCIGKINKMYEAYKAEQNKEPIYMSCSIQFLDGENEVSDVVVKLNTNNEDNSDKVFLYFSSFSDVRFYTKIGAENFIIIDCHKFLDKI